MLEVSTGRNANSGNPGLKEIIELKKIYEAIRCSFGNENQYRL